MKKQITSKKFLGLTLWLIFRLAILNTIIFLITSLIVAARYLIEDSADYTFKFPLILYTTTLFLTNLIYILGICFEIFYLRLWSKEIKLKSFETIFFKIAIVTALVVNLAGTTIYFIKYFNH